MWIKGKFYWPRSKWTSLFCFPTPSSIVFWCPLLRLRKSLLEKDVYSLCVAWPRFASRQTGCEAHAFPMPFVFCVLVQSINLSELQSCSFSMWATLLTSDSWGEAEIYYNLAPSRRSWNLVGTGYVVASVIVVGSVCRWLFNVYRNHLVWVFHKIMSFLPRLLLWAISAVFCLVHLKS